MREDPNMIQPFDRLPPVVEEALRASIEDDGVLVPVAVDQHGRILDGHHRAAIADALGVEYDTVTHFVTDEAHARELAVKLNAIRRPIDPDQRRQVAINLRSQGHSLRAIGGALGVSGEQVRQDVAGVNHLTPATVTGADGKRYPARRKAADVEVGDKVSDDEGDERVVARIEDGTQYLALFDEDDEVIVVDSRKELKVTKPDLGDGISHPARYSSALLPIFADAVPPDDYPIVLDPFAGTGRIHELQNRTFGVEIEREWAGLHPGTIHGSALNLPFRNESVDAIVTSPTYGNRLADSYNSSDPESRRSYHFDLGHELHHDNSGAMHWGHTYRFFHEYAWAEALRVLRPGGRFVLNIKDHIRNGRRQHVAGWHVTMLVRNGLVLLWSGDVATGNLRQGENVELRFDEQVYVLQKAWDS